MDTINEIPTANTIMARHLAAIFDNTLAMVLGVVVAKSIDGEPYQLQLVLFLIAYLGYFFLFEVLISRTPGKILTGLAVVKKDGSRITVGGVAIRTLLRILEVNPALLGYAPAALSIIFSKYNQRIGDRLAGSIVVPPDRIR